MKNQTYQKNKRRTAKNIAANIDKYVPGKKSSSSDKKSEFYAKKPISDKFKSAPILNFKPSKIPNFSKAQQNSAKSTIGLNLDQQNQVLIFGKNPVLAAIISQKRKIYSAYCTESTFQQIQKEAKGSKNSYFWKSVKIVERSAIDKICGENQSHQGVVIIASRLVFGSQFDLLERLNQKIEINNLPKLLVLDQLSDPQNVGAIVRSAVAFGFKDILFCAFGSAKETPAMLKAAAGMAEFANFYVLSNLNDAIAKLKKLGYWCVGLASEGDVECKNFKELSPVVLLVGSEGDGLRKLVKQNCDFLMAIKTAPEVESLNASAASAIAMHKFSNF